MKIEQWTLVQLQSSLAARKFSLNTKQLLGDRRVNIKSSLLALNCTSCSSIWSCNMLFYDSSIKNATFLSVREIYTILNFKNHSLKQISATNIPPTSYVKVNRKMERISFIVAVFLRTVRQRAAYDRPRDVHFHNATIFSRQVRSPLCSLASGPPHFFASLSRSPLEQEIDDVYRI